MNKPQGLALRKRIKSNGFTLIELLVVIAIIGGLSSLFVPNFMAARERARDSQRKSDLKQIQSALELYQQDQSPPSYPSALPGPGSTWNDCPVIGGGLCTPKITYMNKVPGDPKTAVPTPYYYARDPSDALKYTLCGCLDNGSDSDANGTACSGGYTCSSGKSYSLTQP